MIKKFLKNYWPFGIWIILLAVIFSSAFGKYILLPSPDSAPQGILSRTHAMADLLKGVSSVSPHDILALILPPYYYNDITYPIDIFLIAVGFAYFLAGRGIPRLTAAFSGGIFAFMGYSLTLFSAGHRFYFFMPVYVVLLFGFLVRAIAGRGFAYYILAAFCAAWAFRYGADIGTLFLCLAAIYSIFIFIRRIKAEKETSSKITYQFIIGVISAALTFGIVAAPSLYDAFTNLLSGRQAQIEQSQTVPQSSSTNDSLNSQHSTPNTKENSELTKWIFTTNWSLPPGEILEFAAPAVKGRQTNDPESPYWGELGRTWEWEKTHQGFFNFRQHVIYLGAIPVSLALLAFAALFLKRKESDTETDKTCRAETIFWCSVWIIALLLAFGRYTPFYKLFYSIPYISYLRAPVKFIRLVEFSTAALAAIGLARLLACSACEKLPRLSASISGGLALFFAIFAIVVKTNPESFCAPLKELGAQSLIPLMSAKAVAALMHAVIGFGIVAILSEILYRKKLDPQIPIAVLSIAVAIDVAIVAKPFAYTYDGEYQYTDKNPVTAAALSMNDIRLVGNLVQDQNLNKLLRDNLAKNEIGCQPYSNINHMEFLSSPDSGGIIRMLELTGCGYAVMQQSDVRQIPAGRIELISALRPQNSPTLFAKTDKHSANDYILVKLRNPQPYAKLYTNWVYNEDTEWLKKVAEEMGNPNSNRLVVSALPVKAECTNPEATPGKAEVISYYGRNGALETKVKTTSETIQVLALLTSYNESNIVFIDGNKTQFFRAGYNGTGVLVLPGEHIITIRGKPRHTPVAAASASLLIVFFALLVKTVISDKHEDNR